MRIRVSILAFPEEYKMLLNKSLNFGCEFASFQFTYVNLNLLSVLEEKYTHFHVIIINYFLTYYMLMTMHLLHFTLHISSKSTSEHRTKSYASLMYNTENTK
jgi:hypothetical protein